MRLDVEPRVVVVEDGGVVGDDGGVVVAAVSVPEQAATIRRMLNSKTLRWIGTPSELLARVAVSFGYPVVLERRSVSFDR
jgi:hypothetical protein